MITVRNPFRNAARRREFDGIVRAYNAKDRVLFAHTRRRVIDPSGAPAGRAGNSWASTFWAGYDGMTTGVRVARPGELSCPWYVAGRAIAAAEAIMDANDSFDPADPGPALRGDAR